MTVRAMIGAVAAVLAASPGVARAEEAGTPVVIASASSIQMVGVVAGALAEVYEGDFQVVARVGGQVTPRKLTVRFQGHARQDRAFELLAILEPTDKGYYLATFWTNRRQDGNYCLPVDLIAKHGLGGQFRRRSRYAAENERCAAEL